MRKYVALSLMAILSLQAKIIDVKDIDKEGFVLMLGWDNNYDDAFRIASKFPDDEVFIYLDNGRYTVRMVNLKSAEIAKDKLQEAKKIQRDAILWKKMTWLNEQSVSANTEKKVKTSIPIKKEEDEPKQEMKEEPKQKSQEVKKESVTKLFTPPTTQTPIQSQTIKPQIPNVQQLPSTITVRKLALDSSSFTAPLPVGEKGAIFKKGLFVQGVFNKSTDWFIVVASSSDNASWKSLAVPVWVASSSLVDVE